MKHLNKTYLARYIILMSILLIINAFLGITLGTLSSSSLRELIYSHMLDTSKTAAAMIDGDALGNIKKEDQNTPEYKSILKTLTYFLDNMEIEYIYCVKETSKGTFVFTIDSDPEEPAEFGSPIVYTDALREAGNGIPSVDKSASEDQWGEVYSAFCPVFDSNDNVSGIVAVDFSKEWYDEQITSQIRTTIIVISSSLLIGTSMIIILSRNAQKRRRINQHLSQQLYSTADIYISLYEADFINDTYTEIHNRNKEAAKMIGKSGSGNQQILNKVMEAFSAPSTRDIILDFVDLSKLDDRLKDHNTVICEFLSISGKWCRARFIASERSISGKVTNAMWLIEDIHEEKQTRDKMSETAQQLSMQLRTIAYIYTAVYDVDIINDSFVEISSNEKLISNAVVNDKNSAQKALKIALSSLTSDLFREDVLDFVEFRNIEKNTRETGNATIEFLNSKGNWYRGRFIVSERTNEGRLSHVIWTVENIDAERKERESLRDLSERAAEANEAMWAFLVNMAQNIRTPLNSLMTTNDMIINESFDRNTAARSESIKADGNTILELINNMRDFSELEAGRITIKPAEYQLSVMIQDLVEMIKPSIEDNCLEFIPDINDDIPGTLWGDVERIRQIIANILTNAVKYTEKGSVTLSIQYRRLADDKNSIILAVSVKDTGIGIKKEDIEKLFSKFDRIENRYDHRVKGAGLGINITQRLLELMDSTLEVESVYGEGTTFSFGLRQRVVSWEKLNYNKKLTENTENSPTEATDKEVPETAEKKLSAAPDPKYRSDSTIIPEFLYGIVEISPYCGIKNCGSPRAFMQTLYTFSHTFDKTLRNIKLCCNAKDISKTTEALEELSSVFRMIGAVLLSDMAQGLEADGREENIIKLAHDMPLFLNRCRRLSSQLTPLRMGKDNYGVNL